MHATIAIIAALGAALPDGLEFRRKIDVRTELQPLLRSSYIATSDGALALEDLLRCCGLGCEARLVAVEPDARLGLAAGERLLRRRLAARRFGAKRR